MQSVGPDPYSHSLDFSHDTLSALLRQVSHTRPEDGQRVKGGTSIEASILALLGRSIATLAGQRPLGGAGPCVSAHTDES